MVRADFDQMGILLVNNLIPKDVFLGAYWHTVLLCWKALKQNIANERDVRANPSYMQYFQKLKVEAESYWREHHSEVKEIKL
jgi:hypothetical protein